MKKRLAALLTAVLCLSVFAGCGSAKEDLAYIKDNGEMIMGITLFEPMNYNDENGELTGFETEFAEAVCEKLGVEAKFQVIDWKQKENELRAKSIDCIWNGLTVTDERRENMAFSTSYVSNYQVAVIRKADAEKYADIASMAGANMIAENGSAGQSTIEKNATLSQNKFIAAAAQKDALLEVKAGTSDVAVLDYIMARTLVNDATDYSDLMIAEVDLGSEPEEYAIGFRLEDEELVAAVNKAIEELAEEGFMAELAEKYAISDALLLK
ncbi:MAG: transporter substrate-binding domain-containing protein [Lachnospiraceae bacterium]|nr:transporter substrate-binding domain-containing protein [Lachnospiraceae bacterium]